MTIEKIIRLLRHLTYHVHDETVIKLQMAIEYLEQLEQSCEDAISRFNMLDAIGHGTTYTSEDLQRIIKALPPVTPIHKDRTVQDFVDKCRECGKQKKGKWISKPHMYGVTYCSECDFELKIDDTNYCPNCGSFMVTEENENDDR